MSRAFSCCHQKRLVEDVGQPHSSQAALWRGAPGATALLGMRPLPPAARLLRGRLRCGDMVGLPARQTVTWLFTPPPATPSGRPRPIPPPRRAARCPRPPCRSTGKGAGTGAPALPATGCATAAGGGRDAPSWACALSCPQP